MTNWRRQTPGEFLSLQRGYDLTSDEREAGNVPVIGAAGQNGFHNKALANAPGIVVGRSGGSFGQIHLVMKDFWPHNTAMFVTDFKDNDAYFAYYLLKNLNFNQFNSGSAQPSLNRNFICPISINVPVPKEQKNCFHTSRSRHQNRTQQSHQR
jgi:type I restriction enzyme S subunit